jgi:hypothetical protein
MTTSRENSRLNHDTTGIETNIDEVLDFEKESRR